MIINDAFICPNCGERSDAETFRNNLFVCPRCNYHSRLTWQDRLAMTADEGSFVELDAGMESGNPLGFPGYSEKIRSLAETCGAKEALVSGVCRIMGYAALIGIMDSRFLMASMGSVVGEKIARLFEKGAAEKLPVVIFAASGGARMQEGMFSLMQMAKTSAAAAALGRAGQLFVSVMADPTTGGVTASFASLGDVIIAEPGATIGFAGKRVIENTIGEKLPPNFQTAEFIADHGFADLLLGRRDLRAALARIFAIHGYKSEESLTTNHANHTNTGIIPASRPAGAAHQPLPLERRMELLKGLGRPVIGDYIPLLFRDFIEFRGDRCYGDVPALLGGVAIFPMPSGGIPVTVIAQKRAKDIAELQRINFSMPHPEGYRKALRLARQAEKFGRPVICFIDTPGAYCGIGAEERGQGEAIARCIQEFSTLRTPVLSVVLGEGGSGGALALGVCDELAMLENALYSVISPRGFASIVWKESGRELEAAELMKIGAADLKNFGICDTVIQEAEGGAANGPAFTAANIAAWIAAVLPPLLDTDRAVLLERRYQKYRKIGEWKE